MSITTDGPCIVTASYSNYGLLGSPGTWGSDGACAWCEAGSQTVYTDPADPAGYTFQCDNSGQANSMACTLIEDCNPGPTETEYVETIVSSLQTVTVVGDGPGCVDYNCVNTEYVTTTQLVPAGVTVFNAFTSTPVPTSTSPTTTNAGRLRTAEIASRGTCTAWVLGALICSRLVLLACA